MFEPLILFFNLLDIILAIDNKNETRNDQQQTSRGDQQLSRREIELLYTEMKKLQDEVEQHRSRFQENSQSTFGDCERYNIVILD